MDQTGPGERVEETRGDEGEGGNDREGNIMTEKERV
uniref:Uncharacterized protein n=1 Tax=Nelumbo nucifera TaxID=4432 RepID=A0A822ZLM2_NELNU|nr:TPA_asm: hypothetical protein HUJ06_002106 [Nelumbo nucifera]DAD44126.1 TPA_asm: hypothetical protein HUJ06_002356 [Nelumbo nucifera]